MYMYQNKWFPKQSNPEASRKTYIDCFKNITVNFNSQMRLTLGKYKGGVEYHPPRGFSEFFLSDPTSAPEVFSSRSLILLAHFETSLGIIGCYGYEI